MEDDPDIRESVDEILTIEGYSVAQAVNGQDALNVLARISVPGLILLDLMMPVMTGPEFLTRLKAEPVFRACSGRSRSLIPEQADHRFRAKPNTCSRLKQWGWSRAEDLAS